MRKHVVKSDGAGGGTKKPKKSSATKVGVQKSRVREGKELSKLYESIAKETVSKELVKMENKIHLYVGELLSKSLSEYRHDVLMMESSMSARLTAMETKLSDTSMKVDLVHTECQNMVKTLNGDMTKIGATMESLVDNEQQKRLELYKKLQTRDEKRKTEMKANISAMKEEADKSLVLVNEELKSQSQELSRIRDNVDLILMKRNGFVPSTKYHNENPTSIAGHGLDAGSILDNLTMRLQGLETQLQMNDTDSISEPLSMKKRMESMEKQMNSLRRHVLDCEEDLKNIKGSGGGKSRGSAVPGDDSEEIKSLQRKLKRLAENTTRACKSLSGGLSDVQQATLNLYAWTDKAHDSFGVVSDKLGFVGNVCPRAKVNSNKSYENAMY